MGLPVPKNMMIQSSGRSLSIDFFSDEEVQKIFLEISQKIITDKRRSEKHKRYFLLVQFLYRTGARIDEVLIIKPSDINLTIPKNIVPTAVPISAQSETVKVKLFAP